MDNEEKDLNNEDGVRELEPEVSEASSEQPTRSASKTSRKRRKSKLPMVVLIIGILGIAGYMFYGKPTTTGAVAIVNGVTITQSELDARVKQVRPLLEEQGYNFDDQSTVSKLEFDVLNDLITTKLLVNKSIEAGITVSAEDVDERVNVLMAQWGDEEKFNAELVRRGVTLAELKRDLSDQIAIDKLLEKEFPADSYSVTNEEIESLYNMVALQQEVPPLDEVRDQIFSQLSSQKRQTDVTEYVENLRNASDIELFLVAPDPVVPPLAPKDTDGTQLPPPPAPTSDDGDAMDAMEE